ncbi:hypothetical protein [Acidovorax sp. CF316]|uniref:hypothetical protein n=1 Tax=Acidovorax sp. CF316 TaxID=1144317 RepID=UPI0011B25E8E|nr:hypothetical protein [Acidovorax sp. CF316]
MGAAFARADVCTSPPPGIGQASLQRGFDLRCVTVQGLTPGILVQCVLAGLLLALPCGPKAFAAPPVHALHQLIDLSPPRPAAHHVWSGAFLQQPSTDWVSRIVELLSPVPPKCRAVADKQPSQKCEERKKGTLEQLKHDHPLLFNLALACAAFVLGFYLTGGFGGEK